MELSRDFKQMSINGETKQKPSGKKDIKHLSTSKKASLNKLPKKQYQERYCPNRMKSEKKCKKHTMCRLKSKSFGCEFCIKRFEFKSFLIAHTKSSHQELMALEQIAERIFKGIILNEGKTGSGFEKYSKIR
ncbi:zinc finger protein PLAG1-like [Contarinia nasturtii]|uniref:zinc finger protein PLAG1-like n=1 Tax=Contarinia nasturtii TaxID=265458 RepID=UPI0012D4890B|nr:zinc finger protein PLAG1-like [Contarinia nasturtii]